MPWVFNSLRERERHILVDPRAADRIALTVTVVDRFSMRSNLVPCEPVLVPPLDMSAPVHVQLQLYACTGQDSDGYHYEWIAAEPTP